MIEFLVISSLLRKKISEFYWFNFMNKQTSPRITSKIKFEHTQIENIITLKMNYGVTQWDTIFNVISSKNKENCKNQASLSWNSNKQMKHVSVIVVESRTRYIFSSQQTMKRGHKMFIISTKSCTTIDALINIYKITISLVFIYKAFHPCQL